MTLQANVPFFADYGASYMSEPPPEYSPQPQAAEPIRQPGEPEPLEIHEFYQDIFEKRLPAIRRRLERFQANWGGSTRVDIEDVLPEVAGSIILSIVKKERIVKTSSQFSAEDFADAHRLAQKLAARKDTVSRYLYSKLSPATRQLLLPTEHCGQRDEQPEKALADDFNSLLEESSLYEAEQFQAVTLRANTKKLLATQPTGAELARFNRLLLEDAYPQEIARIIDNLSNFICIAAENELRRMMKAERSESLDKKGHEEEGATLDILARPDGTAFNPRDTPQYSTKSVDTGNVVRTTNEYEATFLDKEDKQKRRAECFEKLVSKLTAEEKELLYEVCGVNLDNNEARNKPPPRTAKELERKKQLGATLTARIAQSHGLSVSGLRTHKHRIIKKLIDIFLQQCECGLHAYWAKKELVKRNQKRQERETKRHATQE